MHEFFGAAPGVVDELVSAEFAQERLMPARCHRDDTCALPLRQLEREVAHAARGAVDEHPRAGVESRRAVPRLLEGRGVIVSDVDQELPHGEPGHGRPGGMHVVDGGRLACEVRRRRGHVFGVGAAVEAGETQQTEDLIADGERVHARGDGLDDTRHVRPRDHQAA
ncbi:hypothetical protein NDW01_07025 [Actinoallomurus sp. WRP6H-15]|nr:hypothetical protein [Actinoallomurus soli]MCO5968147.1 hypothetical protein [Actinoallomurus soli]